MFQQQPLVSSLRIIHYSVWREKAAGGSDATKAEIRFGFVSCVFKGTLHLTVSCEKGADQSGRGFGT